MLSELIYVSNRVNIGDSQEIDDILSICQNNNKDKITGTLLYSRTKFIQYLEGDYQDVKATFDRIKKDPRHKSVQLVIFSPIKQRVFPGWVMGRKNMEDVSVTLKSKVSDKEARIFEDLLDGNVNNNHVLSGIIKKFFE
ncbi:MAG: BLUF domain-containing protein [Cyclobacteriaceae bacterium]